MKIKIGQFTIDTDNGLNIAYEQGNIVARVSFVRIATPLNNGEQLSTQIKFTLTEIKTEDISHAPQSIK